LARSPSRSIFSAAAPETATERCRHEEDPVREAEGLGRVKRPSLLGETSRGRRDDEGRRFLALVVVSGLGA
jgi:hypothetical protein